MRARPLLLAAALCLPAVPANADYVCGARAEADGLASGLTARFHSPGDMDERISFEVWRVGAPDVRVSWERLLPGAAELPVPDSLTFGVALERLPRGARLRFQQRGGGAFYLPVNRDTVSFHRRSRRAAIRIADRDAFFRFFQSPPGWDFAIVDAELAELATLPLPMPDRAALNRLYLARRDELAAMVRDADRRCTWYETGADI